MVDSLGIKGHIKIECFDKDHNIIDSWDEHNLIMDLARTQVANILTGNTSSLQLNRFVLGTQGHVTGDQTKPKTISEGFTSTRTELFSEESGDYTYEIAFKNDPTTVIEDDGSETLNKCTITSTDTTNVVQLNRGATSLEYIFTLDYDNGNGIAIGTDPAATQYTEAALYVGDNIFSMKCFSGKIKDDLVLLKITWKITF